MVAFILVLISTIIFKCFCYCRFDRVNPTLPLVVDLVKASKFVSSSTIAFYQCIKCRILNCAHCLLIVDVMMISVCVLLEVCIFYANVR